MNDLVRVTAWQTRRRASPAQTERVQSGLVRRLFVLALALSPVFTNGGFELRLHGAMSSGFVLQCSTNLVQWTSLVTNTIPDAPLSLLHPAAPNYPALFFRAVPWR